MQALTNCLVPDPMCCLDKTLVRSTTLECLRSSPQAFGGSLLELHQGPDEIDAHDALLVQQKQAETRCDDVSSQHIQ